MCKYFCGQLLRNSSQQNNIWSILIGTVLTVLFYPYFCERLKMIFSDVFSIYGTFIVAKKLLGFERWSDSNNLFVKTNCVPFNFIIINKIPILT